MLREIAIVTLTVANPGVVGDEWKEYFGYEVVERGEISAELAEHWSAPAVTGEDYTILQPPGGATVYVRLVGQETAENYRPMTSHGWNATELLVRDPDSLAEQLRDSQFEILGEPRDLWPGPDAPRIMQALGPGNELLYLTNNGAAMDALGLDPATMPAVERPFIMVAGGPSMAEFRDFYAGTLGLAMDDPAPFRITMISKANDLPLDTTYPLAVVRLAPGYLLELDEMPAVVGAREIVPGQLPPGVAVVGFTAPSEAAGELDWVGEPTRLEDFPYGGRRVGLLRGPAGELLEVVLDD